MADKKKKFFVDEDGKQWDLSQFDDTRSWSRPKRVKPRKESYLPNLLGKV